VAFHPPTDSRGPVVDVKRRKCLNKLHVGA